MENTKFDPISSQFSGKIGGLKSMNISSNSAMANLSKRDTHKMYVKRATFINLYLVYFLSN